MDEAKFEFGTEKNPIVLEKINTPRPLISRCVRFNPEARNSSELVSIDFTSNPHSAIIDAPSTSVIEGNRAKVLAWYDNEFGFSNRLVELVEMIGNSMWIEPIHLFSHFIWDIWMNSLCDPV